MLHKRDLFLINCVTCRGYLQLDCLISPSDVTFVCESIATVILANLISTRLEFNSKGETLSNASTQCNRHSAEQMAFYAVKPNANLISKMPAKAI